MIDELSIYDLKIKLYEWYLKREKINRSDSKKMVELFCSFKENGGIFKQNINIAL